MRKLIGGLVLVCGVGGLGTYAAQVTAVTIQDQIASAAAAVAATSQHAMTATVSGRDISVTGTVEDAAEQAALLSAFDAIAGRRAIEVGDLRLLPVQSPYTATLEKTVDAITVTGFAPSAQVNTALGVDLTVANGEPEGWAEALTAAQSAAQSLDAGKVALVDQGVVVSGAVANPDAQQALDAALKTLPAGFVVETDVVLIDDGTPLRLILSFDGTVLSGTGKIPSDLPETDLALPDIATALEVKAGAIPSPDGLWPAVATQAVSALGALQSGNLAMEAASVVINGVGTPDEIAAAKAALADLPDGYAAIADFQLYDDGTPFRLSAEKVGDVLTASGKVTADFVDARNVLSEIEGVEVAFITDKTGVWPGIAERGLQALALLDHGTLDIADGVLSLQGEAFSSVEQQAILSVLDETVDLVDISISQAGRPAHFVMRYTGAEGARVTGQLPSGVDAAALGQALGVPVAAENTTQSALVGGGDPRRLLNGLRTFLPLVDEAGVTWEAGEAVVDVTASPGVDPVQLGQALSDALGLDVASAAPSDLPAEGATRRNPMSQQAEVFTAGYWMPVLDFFPTPENCAQVADDLVADDPLVFAAQTDVIDIRSTPSLNAIAAVARKCALEGGVFLRVDHYTDEAEGTAANLTLSTARANAVRDALLRRGLARAVVSAQGFGADAGQPSRTALTWNFE